MSVYQKPMPDFMLSSSQTASSSQTTSSSQASASIVEVDESDNADSDCKCNLPHLYGLISDIGLHQRKTPTLTCRRALTPLRLLPGVLAKRRRSSLCMEHASLLPKSLTSTFLLMLRTLSLVPDLQTSLQVVP